VGPVTPVDCLKGGLGGQDLSKEDRHDVLGGVVMGGSRPQEKHLGKTSELSEFVQWG